MNTWNVRNLDKAKQANDSNRANDGSAVSLVILKLKVQGTL